MKHPDRTGPLVLGGGVAGIAAAVELAGAGLRPILVESRPYLGGRMRSFVHAASGDEIDNGQHLMMGCYRSTLRLLELLGTRSLVELQPSLRVEFRDADGRSNLLATSRHLPSPLDVLIGMLRLGGLSAAERLGLLRIGAAARFFPPNPSESVREYLNRHGQSARAAERLWNPLVIATLNTPPQRASAELFVELMRRAFLGSGDDSRLGFARAGLSRLIEPATGYIESRGGMVLTGTPLVGIELRGEDYHIHRKEGPPLVANHVISALPPHALRSLLMPTTETLRPSVPEALQYSPIVSLYLWFSDPLHTMPEFAALLGTGVQWVFNRRRIAGESAGAYPGLLSCTISAAAVEAAQDSESIVAMAERELRSAFPEIGGARLVDSLVIKERQATILATPEAEPLRPGSRPPLPGFFLAGDWTATGLPATIEGAVQSGFDAAWGVMEEG